MKLLHRVREFDHFPNKWELTRLIYSLFEIDVAKEEQRWRINKTGGVWEVTPNERGVYSPCFGFDNYLPALLLWILLEKELINQHGREYLYGRKQAQETYASLRGQEPGEDFIPGDDECEARWGESDGSEWSSFEQELEADP